MTAGNTPRRLTARQALVVLAIYRHQFDHHESPSWVDLGRAVGLCPTGEALGCHFRALEKKGWIAYAIKDGRRICRTVLLAGAPMKRTPMGLIPVVDTRTPAGLALLDVLSPRVPKSVPA